jgi:hypothetical protein
MGQLIACMHSMTIVLGFHAFQYLSRCLILMLAVGLSHLQHRDGRIRPSFFWTRPRSLPGPRDQGCLVESGIRNISVLSAVASVRGVARWQGGGCC